MVSSMEEFFRVVSVSMMLIRAILMATMMVTLTVYLFQEWLCPKRSTYANPENTYSYM